MINKNEWLVVGLITSCHGINGQVKVKSLSDFEERFLKPGIRWLQKENESPRKIKLTSGYKQPGKETFIIKFEGINTRDNSEQLKKYKILVKTNKLPKLEKEEFHLLELINLQVKILENDELKIIGKVINLSQLPPSNRTAALFLVTRCTKPLYPLYIELLSFTTTKEPGSIGLGDNSIEQLI